jgi:LPXTG-motif cell wall-anchored protein
VKPRASVRIADQSGGSGSPWPVIGGVGGAAALGAGAFLVAHRRRAAEGALDQPDPE